MALFRQRSERGLLFREDRPPAIRLGTSCQEAVSQPAPFNTDVLRITIKQPNLAFGALSEAGRVDAACVDVRRKIATVEFSVAKHVEHGPCAAAGQCIREGEAIRPHRYIATQGDYISLSGGYERVPRTLCTKLEMQIACILQFHAALPGIERLTS